jgi:periplasmic protein TonB
MPVSRNALIALAVVVLHVGMLWLFQSGLLMRTAELLVPVEVLARLIEPPVIAPPVPVVEPPRPVAKAPPPLVVKPMAPRAEATPEKPPQAAPRQQPAPQPQAVAEPSAPSPAPNTPTALPAPPQPAPVAAAPSAPAIQLPSSDADYLQNPEPKYPENSKRLNEQGTSTIRVLIGADGQPQRAEMGQSSGFDRLDRAALATVMRWRYVPGKRNGVPEAMWFSVPIVWKLTNQ